MEAVEYAEHDGGGQSSNIDAAGSDGMPKDIKGAKRDAEHMDGINGECGCVGFWGSAD
jgi:hypothetical protein